MRITRVSMLLIVFSFIATGGWTISLNASTPTNAATNQKSTDTGILSFFSNLFSALIDNAPTPTAYTDQITAETVDTNQPDSLRINAKIAAGENVALPGVFQISLQYNRVNQTVIGGQWTRIVEQTNSDGTTGVRGSLRGTLSGGTITFNEDGSIKTLAGITLRVEGGTDAYAQINAGGGEFSGNFRSMNSPVEQPTPPIEPPTQPTPSTEPSPVPSPSVEPTPAPLVIPPAFSGTVNLTF